MVVQPNFHVFAFDPISDAVLARLDSFATRLKADRAVEYEITRESIYRAQQNGQQFGAIVAWLEEVTAATLPQNVGRSLDDWQAAFERIVVRQRVGSLQTATAELADALAADPGLAGAIVKRIGPTSLLLVADRVDEVERALLAAGELPARTTRPKMLAKPASPFRRRRHRFRPRRADPLRLRPSAPVRRSERRRLAHHPGERASGARCRPGCRRDHHQPGHPGAGGVPPSSRCASRPGASISATRPPDPHPGPVPRSARAQRTARRPILGRYLKPFKPEARLGLAVVKPGDIAAVQALLAQRGVELTQAH